MISLHCAYLWILFVVANSHSQLTDKKLKDGIGVKSACETNEIVINNLQNQINQETVIRLSLLKQVYSLVNDMINVKNEMAVLKTNTEDIRKSTDDLQHKDKIILSEIEQIKHDQNYTSEMIMSDTSEMIINAQHEHNKMMDEIELKMKLNQNDTDERIVNAQHEYKKTFIEIEQKMKFNHNDTSERTERIVNVQNELKTMLNEIEQKIKFNHNDTSEKIENAQLEYKAMFSELEQNMEFNHSQTSERIINVQNNLLNVNNSVGLIHNHIDEIKAHYGTQEKTVRGLVSEHEKIQERLDALVLHNEDVGIETQLMLANNSRITLQMKEELRNLTYLASILHILLHQVQDCLNSSDCWLQYSFEYDNSWNGCEGGAQYVKKTNYSSAPYLGVMTCSSTRYKLFLGKTLTGKYYNIADGSGSGEDQCELLGTTKNGIIPRDYRKSPNTEGFYRSHRGGSFSFVKIGSVPSQTSNWYEQWIDCGVNVPGDDRVIAMLSL